MPICGALQTFLKLARAFKDADISYLENENATVENVRAAVDLFLDRARENDLMFLFVASHGTRTRLTRRICILCCTTAR